MLKKRIDLLLLHIFTKSTIFTNKNKIIQYVIGPGSLFFNILSYLFRTSFKNGNLYILKLDLINDCNLKCKFCYVNNKTDYLTIKDIYKLVDSLKYGEIQLMGGEPLLRKDIFEIIRYIKKKGIKCALYTNATLITDEVAAKLKEAGLNYAVVNLISDKEKDHDSLTSKKGSWKKTVTGIKNLVNAKIKTYTYTSIHLKNINRLNEINNFTKSIGATQIFHRYMPQSKHDPLSITNKKQWKKVKRWILYEKSPSHSKIVSNFLFVTSRSCYGGYMMLSVKANGNVTPCPFIDDLVIGNIKNENINNIYSNRFKNKNFIKFFNPSKDCKGCSLVNICSGGCRAGNIFNKGDYTKKDNLCFEEYKGSINPEDICDCVPYWW